MPANGRWDLIRRLKFKYIPNVATYTTTNHSIYPHIDVPNFNEYKRSQ